MEIKSAFVEKTRESDKSSARITKKKEDTNDHYQKWNTEHLVLIPWVTKIMRREGTKMSEEWDGETTFSPSNSSKEHLNAEQTPQNNFWLLTEDIPRKAAHCLQKEVGQNIKDKKRDKRVMDRDPSRERSLNRGSFQTPGNPRTGGSGGSFWISEGNITGRKNK